MSRTRSSRRSSGAAGYDKPYTHRSTGTHRSAWSRALWHHTSGMSGSIREPPLPQTYTYPATSKMTPMARPIDVMICTPGFAHNAPVSQTWVRRRHSSKAAVAIAAAPIINNAVRCGAATTAKRNNQALPSPRLANKIGRAQHDAVARPASKPAAASITVPAPVGLRREGLVEVFMSSPCGNLARVRDLGRFRGVAGLGRMRRHELAERHCL
jgi:hypothetical protein